MTRVLPFGAVDIPLVDNHSLGPGRPGSPKPGCRCPFGWGELDAGWRHLEYDMKSGRPIKDLNFSGAMVGATFRCNHNALL